VLIVFVVDIVHANEFSCMQSPTKCRKLNTHIRKQKTNPFYVVTRAVKFVANLVLFKEEMGGPCSTNGGVEERLYIIGGKARGKETTKKTKT
jgi:hypothetical protein